MGSANCCSRDPDDTHHTFPMKISEEEKIAMIIKIQKAFRGYLGRKRAAAVRGSINSRNFVMSEGEVVKLTD